MYKDIISVKTSGIIYCQGEFPLQSNIYYYLSLLLEIGYLIVFVVSFIVCQKMVGVETIFLIQLAYYSFIPVGLYCKPFASFNIMKYVSGINFLFKGLESITISNNYESMGISSNFISNVNFMILPLILCPIMYFPLVIISKRSVSYKVKPRALMYARACLF